MPAASSRGSNELLSEVRWLQWIVRGSNQPLSTTNLHLPKSSVQDLSWSGIKRRLQRIFICRISQCCSLGDDPPLLTTSLHLSNLSVMDLSYSMFTVDWEGWWSSFTMVERLQVLNLGHCLRLRRTPDLSAFTQLKVLRLYHCAGLEHLHPSIGKLKSLVSLDLMQCRSLKELQEEVGELKDLEELELEYSGITEIPTSIGSLSKLKKLTAIYCKSLREIPSSIGDLQNLQHLHLSDSGIEKLPSAIGRLKNLETLHLNSCCSLKGPIPSEIGDLSSLKILDIAWAPISNLPKSIRNLSSLQRLYLGSRSLPEQLPTGLTYLHVACQSPRLPQLSSLIHLEELHLRECHILEDIPELLSRLSKLCIEECGKLKLLKLNGLKNLGVLWIKKCISIERLLCPESRCLKTLKVVRCNNLVEIRGLHDAKFLKALDFTGCESMEMLPNLIGCGKLQCLIVRNCKKLTQLRGLEKLDSIDLDISGCDSLEVIPKLSGMYLIRNYEQKLYCSLY